MRDGQFFRKFSRVVLRASPWGTVGFLPWFVDVREVAAFGPTWRDGKQSMINEIVLRSGFTIPVSESIDEIASMLEATHEAASSTQAAA